MQTQAQSHVPGLSRADRNRIAAFAMETWSEAQQMDSTLSPHVSKKDIGNAQEKFFSYQGQLELTRKNEGTVLTPESNLTTGARRLRVLEYHDSIRADISDRATSDVDVIMSAREEYRHAIGRLTDSVILQAAVAQSAERVQGTADGNQFIPADTDTTAVFKNPAWCADVLGDADSDLTEFSSANLDDIRAVFSKRDVQDTICITLTNRLERILRKDASFQNAENLFSASIGRGSPYRAGLMASQRHFDYKGFTFVYTFDDVLPIISNTNIGAAANTSRTANTEIAVQGLDRPTAGIRETRTTALNLTSGSPTYAQVETTSLDLIHCWAPKAIYFADRAAYNMLEIDRRPDFSYATQIYVRVGLGAMCIDDKFVLSAVLGGTLKRART